MTRKNGWENVRSAAGMLLEPLKWSVIFMPFTLIVEAVLLVVMAGVVLAALVSSVSRHYHPNLSASRTPPASRSRAVSKPWVHGTRLGREHTSLRQHLIEDHGVQRGWTETASDGAVRGLHDGRHDRTGAYALNLPHEDWALGPAETE